MQSFIQSCPNVKLHWKKCNNVTLPKLLTCKHMRNFSTFVLEPVFWCNISLLLFPFQRRGSENQIRLLGCSHLANYAVHISFISHLLTRLHPEATPQLPVSVHNKRPIIPDRTHAIIWHQTQAPTQLSIMRIHQNKTTLIGNRKKRKPWKFMFLNIIHFILYSLKVLHAISFQTWT